MEPKEPDTLAVMTAGIVHDVKDALSIVTLWAKLAQAKSDDAEVQEALANVVKGAQLAATVLRRLRLPIEGGRRRWQPLDLNQLVAECLAFSKPLWKPRAEAEQVCIRVERHFGKLPRVVGNVDELREAVANLIQNAIEAMPNGGTLTLKTYGQEDRACIAICDTGVGIRNEDMKRIFEPRYTTKGNKGVGVGLSVVQSVVAAHRGQVVVHSEEGEGTTVIVALPVSRDGR